MTAASAAAGRQRPHDAAPAEVGAAHAAAEPASKAIPRTLPTMRCQQCNRRLRRPELGCWPNSVSFHHNCHERRIVADRRTRARRARLPRSSPRRHHPHAPRPGPAAVVRDAAAVGRPGVFLGRRILEHPPHRAVPELEQPRAVAVHLEHDPAAVRRHRRACGPDVPSAASRRSAPRRSRRSRTISRISWL